MLRIGKKSASKTNGIIGYKYCLVEFSSHILKNNNMLASQTLWSVDQSKSRIAFKVDPLIFSGVEGTFRKFDAIIRTLDRDFSTIEIDLQIDASSISTGDVERDEHLRSPDFFDVKRYPKIGFRSKKVKLNTSKSSHELIGELTIKNIKREIKANVQFNGVLTDSTGKESAAFVITGSVNRKDWGLLWNESPETGGLMEAELVKIYCEVMLRNES
jgi:polyisoprenoid-binding protein YceI